MENRIKGRKDRISEYIALKIACTVSHKEFNNFTNVIYVSR